MLRLFLEQWVAFVCGFYKAAEDVQGIIKMSVEEVLRKKVDHSRNYDELAGNY